MPTNIVIDSTAIITIVAAAFFDFGRLERGNAVRHRLDAGHRRAAVGKRGQQQEQRQRVADRLNRLARLAIG